MSINHSDGSKWSKWDLHIHTPASLQQNYGGDTPEAWEKFITDLRNLPEEFKAIGVSDYFFIDGYKKLRQEKRDGKLPNIDLILPIIELRLRQFAGAAGDWARINYHVIFSEEIEPDTIEQQFIYAMAANYHLEPGLEAHQASWSGVLTRDALIDLGNSIIAGLPEDKKAGKSPLEEGFRNICIPLDSVKEILNRNYFSGKHLTTIGKAEWASMRWDQAAAEKKSLINGAHMVFTASATIDSFKSSQKKLQEEKVNSKLFDCSDAHHFSDSKESNRLGQCYTWVKADPTFDGLAHALIEYDDSVFIGDCPPKVEHAKRNPTKFIKSIKLSKKASSPLKEHWFDQEITFNTDLITIVGRKGSGKSALADIIALIGNSKRQKSFSFLRPDKFCSPKGGNRAEHFEAQLTWRDNTTTAPIPLNSRVDDNTVETVKYIPQQLLEEICTELGKTEESQFEGELKSVIFSHVPEAEKQNFASLDELVSKKAAPIKESMGIIIGKLHAINQEIVELETKSAPSYRQKLEGELAQKKQALAALEANPPKATPPPSGDATSELQKFIEDEQKKLGALKSDLTRTEEDLKQLITKRDAATRIKDRLANLKTTFESFKTLVTDDCDFIGVNADTLAKLELNTKPIESILSDLASKILKCNFDLNPGEATGIAGKIQILESEIKKSNEKLDAPAKAAQEAKKRLELWEAQKTEIIGKDNKLGSIKYYENQLTKISNIPSELSILEQKRVNLSKEVYEKICTRAEVYRELYKPVQEFISTNSTVKAGVPLEFEVTIKDTGFKEMFFTFFSQSAAGSYNGREPGDRYLTGQLAKTDFSSEASALAFLEDIRESLRKDYRQNPPKPTILDAQLKTGQKKLDFYDFLYSFEFLKPRYTMRYAGRELGHLSPGERGTLLLVFYLLVDKREDPILLDQPEENLDNETVVDVLVPCIKKAKEKRQIFIITHNANLAVVCNAEQVIIAKIDRKGGNHISYTCGGIENTNIKKGLVDVLEGTARAFGNRKSKYFLLGRTS